MTVKKKKKNRFYGNFLLLSYMTGTNLLTRVARRKICRISSANLFKREGIEYKEDRRWKGGRSSKVRQRSSARSQDPSSQVFLASLILGRAHAATGPVDPLLTHNSVLFTFLNIRSVNIKRRLKITDSARDRTEVVRFARPKRSESHF